MQVTLPQYTQAPSKGIYYNGSPGNTNYIFAAGATPNYFVPHEAVVTVRVTCNLATSGTLIVGMNDGTNTITGTLNGGTALTAGAWYTFTFEARSGYTYDFKLGTAGVATLFVSEVGGGASS